MDAADGASCGNERNFNELCLCKVNTTNALFIVIIRPVYKFCLHLYLKIKSYSGEMKLKLIAGNSNLILSVH